MWFGYIFFTWYLFIKFSELINLKESLLIVKILDPIKSLNFFSKSKLSFLSKPTTSIFFTIKKFLYFKFELCIEDKIRKIIK